MFPTRTYLTPDICIASNVTVQGETSQNDEIESALNLWRSSIRENIENIKKVNSFVSLKLNELSK